MALAEDGRRGVGALYLNRQEIEIAASDTRSTDAWLTDLQVSAAGAQLQLDFSKTTTSYVASVAYEAAEAVVMPTASHGRATIAVQGVPAESGEGSAGVALGVGSTRVETVVTAEDGSSETYVIDVTRAPRGENVEVRADGFTLTCPASVDEGTDVSCTLANGSGRLGRLARGRDPAQFRGREPGAHRGGSAHSHIESRVRDGRRAGRRADAGAVGLQLRLRGAVLRRIEVGVHDVRL